MTAGDEGVAIVVDLGDYDATGNTCAMYAAPGRPGEIIGATETLTPVTISDDGHFATYVTTGVDDFQSGGYWTVQVDAVPSVGLKFTTPQGSFFVNPHL